MKNKCLKCNNYHDGSFGSGKYCSRACANSRKHSIATKDKISKSLSGREFMDRRGSNIIGTSKVCKTCNKTFKIKYYSYSKYCSIQCNPKIGGVREHSGRGKSGYYKGIYCASTYELCWVIYNIDHGIEFEPFGKMLEGNGIKYLPDFLLGDNKIIEIKGYHTELVDKKKDLAESLGYKISILYKEDLKHMFEYVKTQYKCGNDFQSLYDNHKPKFTYICYNCEKEFSTNNKRKNKETFCSISCARKYRR